MSDAMWMRGVEWLAAAATDPRLCKREWDQGEGIALLEAGRYWDVLSVPDRLGLLTLDLLWQAAPLTRTHARGHRGAPGGLLPAARSRQPVDRRGAATREPGSWVAIPPPYRAARSLEWLVPPDGTGALHAPVTLELALRQANGTLAVLTPMCGR